MLANLIWRRRCRRIAGMARSYRYWLALVGASQYL